MEEEKTEKEIIIEQQSRCRICYLTDRPLMELCQCSGSIAYVHEECILNWITKKLQSSLKLEIPKCEICHRHYSAELKIGPKRLNVEQACQKIKNSWRFVDYLVITILTLGMVLAPIILIKVLVFIINGKITSVGILIRVLSETIFMVYYLWMIVEFIKKRRHYFDQCFVQQVEVTLTPKKFLK